MKASTEYFIACDTCMQNHYACHITHALIYERMQVVQAADEKKERTRSRNNANKTGTATWPTWIASFVSGSNMA